MPIGMDVSLQAKGANDEWPNNNWLLLVCVTVIDIACHTRTHRRRRSQRREALVAPWNCISVRREDDEAAIY